MKRRTSPLPCRVFSYGILRPSKETTAQLDEQLRAARAYKNKLIEIELYRRKRYREITGEHERLAPLVAQIAELDTQLTALRETINAARKDARRRVEQKEASGQARTLAAQLRELRKTHKVIRAEINTDPVIQEAIAGLAAEINDKIKAERAACGAYWGTYLLVEAAMDQARKSKMDPRFRRWDGSGRIGVQVQGGAPVADILSSRCQLLQIDGYDLDAIRSRSGRRRAEPKLRFRIGSHAVSRGPIWAELTLKIHRPLPADGAVKSAWIARRKLGPEYTYQLQIVVEAASFAPEESTAAPAPIAALHLGWRVRHTADGGLRIGYVVDEFGGSRELLMPTAEPAKLAVPRGRRVHEHPNVWSALKHADSLRSIRDRNLDEMRPQLITGLGLLSPDTLPEWITEALRYMHAWRACERFTRFVERWSRERVQGDDAVFALADRWRRQERHLWQWEAHEREGAMRRRKDIYRNIAVELSRKYSLIVLEDFDLRQVARIAKPEEEEQGVTAMRKNRMRAAPSELRMAVSQRLPTAIVNPAGITHFCHACGSVEEFDSAVQIEHCCSACGSVWDIDYNAGMNLLRRYRERDADAPDPGTARDPDFISTDG